MEEMILCITSAIIMIGSFYAAYNYVSDNIEAAKLIFVLTVVLGSFLYTTGFYIAKYIKDNEDVSLKNIKMHQRAFIDGIAVTKVPNGYIYHNLKTDVFVPDTLK